MPTRLIMHAMYFVSDFLTSIKLHKIVVYYLQVHTEGTDVEARPILVVEC